MSAITIYSASAGSGKTFNLVVEYISMLIDSINKGKELGFRNILAITFTNASTKEMKDRIIEVLLSFSMMQGHSTEEKDNPYMFAIKEKTLLEEEEIISYSQKILTEIIHNYSFFNISTIDSFFQLVLRNMAKELGISNGFTILLDDDEYNAKAVRNIILKSKEDTPEGKRLSDWLYRYFLKRQDDNKGWNFSQELEKTLASLFDTDVINALEKEECSLENLLRSEKIIREKIKKIKQETEEHFGFFMQKCKEYNLEQDNFKGGPSGAYYKIEHHFKDLKDKYLLSRLVENFYNGKEYLKTGQTPKDLTKIIEDMDLFLQEKVEEYRSLTLFFDNIYPLGVIKTLYNEKARLLKEDEAFVLKNTKQVLRGLSLQEDNYSDKISFIYEKIGTYLESIMIDEFQDTSSIDWYNLYALIRECISSEDGRAFIFGDIKQSIYRWNNGDWRILHALTQDKDNKVINLKKNFRTFGNIVEFNNHFFSDIYGERYQNQEIKPEYKDKGSVRIKFFSKDDEMLEKTIEEIDYYMQLGYKANDIAILCRDKKNISTLAEYMKTLDMEDKKPYKYNPISDDAFVLSSSGAIKLVVAAMRFLADRNRVISRELILKENPEALEKIEALRKNIYSKTSLFDIVAQICDCLKIDDTIFLPAFYDSVKNFINNFSGNIDNFLDYWDSTLKNQRVETGSFGNSIRLCTIHKSKGLEYNIVIIPYFSWTVFKSTESVWIFNNEDRVCNIPVLRCSLPELEDTCFDERYQEEKLMQRIDNFNLLYVAFTRAKKHLSIVATTTKTKQATGMETNVGNILFNYIAAHREEFGQEGITLLYKNKEALCYKEDNEEQTPDLENPKASMLLNKNALVFSTPSESENYFRNPDTEPSNGKRNFGSMMHAVLSEITKAEDLNNKENIFLGQYKHWEEIKQACIQMLEYTKKRHWFDGTYNILSEKNILYKKDGEPTLKRPDRIMIKEDEVEIVDYKFAKFNKQRHHKYIQQVEEYKSLLLQMGFKEIKSYLWYIDTDISNEENISVHTIINQQIIEIK